MWHSIFSVSFTGSKFNENLKNDHTFTSKLLIIFKTMFIIYVMDTLKIKCKEGGSYFHKNKKYRRLEKEYMDFFRKCSMFRRSISFKKNTAKENIGFELRLKKKKSKQENIF